MTKAMAIMMAKLAANIIDINGVYCSCPFLIIMRGSAVVLREFSYTLNKITKMEMPKSVINLVGFPLKVKGE